MGRLEACEREVREVRLIAHELAHERRPSLPKEFAVVGVVGSLARAVRVLVGRLVEVRVVVVLAVDARAAVAVEVVAAGVGGGGGHGPRDGSREDDQGRDGRGAEVRLAHILKFLGKQASQWPNVALIESV